MYNYERLVYYYSSLPLTVISSTDFANFPPGSNFVGYFVPNAVAVVDATVAVAGSAPIAVVEGIVAAFGDVPAAVVDSCIAPVVG